MMGTSNIAQTVAEKPNCVTTMKGKSEKNELISKQCSLAGHNRLEKTMHRTPGLQVNMGPF